MCAESSFIGITRPVPHTGFVIECLDLNPAMLERDRSAAVKDGVADQIGFVEADFTAWQPAREYDAVMANQVLHHVVNLEGLFRQIARRRSTGRCRCGRRSIFFMKLPLKG